MSHHRWLRTRSRGAPRAARCAGARGRPPRPVRGRAASSRTSSWMQPGSRRASESVTTTMSWVRPQRLADLVRLSGRARQPHSASCRRRASRAPTSHRCDRFEPPSHDDGPTIGRVLREGQVGELAAISCSVQRGDDDGDRGQRHLGGGEGRAGTSPPARAGIRTRTTTTRPRRPKRSRTMNCASFAGRRARRTGGRNVCQTSRHRRRPAAFPGGTAAVRPAVVPVRKRSARPRPGAAWFASCLRTRGRRP